MALDRDKYEDIFRKIYQGASKIPIFGGFSRLLRYPMEGQRQIGGLGEYGLNALFGADEETLRDIVERYQTPLYTSPEEYSKMTGQAGTFSPVLEGMSAGSEARWLLPGGQMDEALRGAAASKVGGKVLPWLAGKTGEGALQGLLTGTSTWDSEDPGSIPKQLLKSTGIGAGLSVGLGALGEGIKALKGGAPKVIDTSNVEEIGKLPKSTRNSLIKQAKSAGTWDSKASASENIKNYLNIRGLTGNTPAETLEKMTQEFHNAINLKQEGLDEIGGLSRGYLEQVSDTIDLAVEHTGLSTSERKVVELMKEKLLTGPQDAKTLDKIAEDWYKMGLTKAGEQRMTESGLYKEGAKAIRDALKEASGSEGVYTQAMNTLSKILGTREAGLISKAASEAEKLGVDIPLISGAGYKGADAKLPFLSDIINKLRATSGRVQESGGLLQSPVLQKLATLGGTQVAGMDTSEMFKKGTIQEAMPEVIPEEYGTPREAFGVPEATGNSNVESIWAKHFGTGQESQPGVNYEQQSALMTLLLMQGGASITEASALSQLILAAQGITPTTENPPSKEEIAISTAESMVDEIEDLMGRIDLYGDDITASVLGGAKQVYGKAVKSSDVGQYMRFRKGISSRLSKALGEVGVLTDKDVERAVELLPTPQDTPESARENLERLRRMLANTKEQYRTGGGSQGTQGSEVSALYEILGL